MKKVFLTILICVVIPMSYGFDAEGAEEKPTRQAEPQKTETKTDEQAATPKSTAMPSAEEDDPPAPSDITQRSGSSEPSKASSGETKDSESPKIDTPSKVEIKTPKVEIKESGGSKEEPAKKEDAKEDAKPDAATKPDSDKLTSAEKEMLSSQRLLLGRVKSPDELFQYLRDTLQNRNYRAAALAMAFEKTNYSTTTLQQECLGQWSHIIDRMESIYPRNFPSFSDRTDRLFRTKSDEITLEFVKDSHNCWQIGPQSISQTDEIFEGVRNDRPMHGDWLSRNVPAWMHRIFLGLSYFRWLILVIGFFGGILGFWIVQKILSLLMRAYMRMRYPNVTRQSETVWKQIGLIAMAFIWFRVFAFVVADPKIYTIAYHLFLVFITLMALVIAMKVIDVLAEALRVHIINKYDYSSANLENLIIPLFSRTLKVLVICIAVVTLAQAFRWPIVGILSGMGIGGIAIAFAAKETVGNFFGSITVLIDRPFEIGDWIETDGISGTVAAVGMRSTRVETLDSSVITIPNNNLTTAVINNLGKRRNRRFQKNLTLQYDTSVDRIDAFCEGIKELILKNAFTQKEGFTVCLYDLQDSSIDVLVNVVFVCPAPETENRERAKLIRNILKLAESLDVRFAYPTQTLYFDRDKQEEYKPLSSSDPLEAGRAAASELLYPPKPTGGTGANDGATTNSATA